MKHKSPMLHLLRLRGFNPWIHLYFQKSMGWSPVLKAKKKKTAWLVPGDCFSLPEVGIHKRKPSVDGGSLELRSFLINSLLQFQGWFAHWPLSTLYLAKLFVISHILPQNFMLCKLHFFGSLPENMYLVLVYSFIHLFILSALFGLLQEWRIKTEKKTATSYKPWLTTHHSE